MCVCVCVCVCVLRFVRDEKTSATVESYVVISSVLASLEEVAPLSWVLV